MSKKILNIEKFAIKLDVTAFSVYMIIIKKYIFTVNNLQKKIVELDFLSNSRVMFFIEKIQNIYHVQAETYIVTNQR